VITIVALLTSVTAAANHLHRLVGYKL